MSERIALGNEDLSLRETMMKTATILMPMPTQKHSSTTPPPTTATTTATMQRESSVDNNSSMNIGVVVANHYNAHLLLKEMNANTIKHTEDMYWLQLELDTTRREKEAVEDRMAELFRDMQELQDFSSGGGGGGSGGGGGTAGGVAKIAAGDATAGSTTVDDDNEEDADILQAKLKKCERVIRILNDQIGLLRSSSDQVVTSLKDELRDLMDDKSRSEVELLNQMTDLEQEKQKLAARVELLEQDKGHVVADDKNKELVAEIQRLKDEKAALSKELKEERTRSRETIGHLRQEKTNLSQKVEKMQGDLLLLRSSAETVRSLEQMQEDRDESLQMLERVALLWDKTDEAIQNLETIMEELKPREEGVEEDDDRDRLLSTLETASLVHGQVKVSLMLIELKMHNNLACLKNDTSQLGAIPSNDPMITEQIQAAHAEAMGAIEQVELVLNQQIEHLEDKSVAETKEVKETLETKIAEMKNMQSRQVKLEEEMTKMSVEELGKLARETTDTDNSAMELFVSRKILERLQNEVLQVVARVKEKNEIIGRLEATIDEHKVRESSLIDELRRLMKERSAAMLEEQARIATEQAKREPEDDDSDEFIEEEIEYTESANLGGEIEEEFEETAHETMFEEVIMESEYAEEEEDAASVGTA